MFKIGDIVVRTDDKSTPINKTDKYHLIGAIFKCLNDGASVSYQKGTMLSTHCRKATNNEIKWFEAGITNINQIPEVGGTFEQEDGITLTITDIGVKLLGYKGLKYGTGGYKLDYWVKEALKTYKPPIKSQHVGNEVPIDTPFEINDLKNCKIGNLTPEDHKIIQPWLFSLGYNWISNNNNIIRHGNAYYIVIGNKYITKRNSLDNYNKNTNTPIKKETILNYIKQLNTNNNYEQINKRTEIKPESRAIRGASIRIPVITGRIASASRLIGNKASGKCVKSQIRKFEIVANIITC